MREQSGGHGGAALHARDRRFWRRSLRLRWRRREWHAVWRVHLGGSAHLRLCRPHHHPGGRRGADRLPIRGLHRRRAALLLARHVQPYLDRLDRVRQPAAQPRKVHGLQRLSRVGRHLRGELPRAHWRIGGQHVLRRARPLPPPIRHARRDQHPHCQVLPRPLQAQEPAGLDSQPRLLRAPVRRPPRAAQEPALRLRRPPSRALPRARAPLHLRIHHRGAD
mmetsp:Transcript_50511/g.107871  ORF Transcript_50511/g.107871 Transcript_50511/m.107871 type:complete len:221 (-) Transcript_50511:1240-1902(-)